ncbi:MAG: hypothetical protein AAFO15_02740 [Pseudomonadota bacterium]
MLGSIIICIGHIIFTFSDHNIDYILLALSYISLGTGIFKPNNITINSEIFREHQDEKLKGFRLAYLLFNIILIPLPIVIGAVFEYNQEYAFLIAAIGMLISLIINYSCWNYFKDAPVQREIKNKTFNAVMLFFGLIVLGYIQYFIIADWSLFSQIYKYASYIFLIILGIMLYNQNSSQRARTTYIIFLMLLFIIYITVHLQITKIFILFFDRNVDTDACLFGISISATALPSLDPVTVLCFTPILLYFFPKEDLNGGVTKISALFITMIGSFAIAYFGTKFTHNSEYQVSAIIPVLAVISIILGEVIFYPFEDAITTTLAPRQYKSMYMAMRCFGMSSASYASTILSKFAAIPEELSSSTITATTEIRAQTLTIYQDYFLLCLKILIILAIITFIIMQTPYIKNIIQQEIKEEE